MRAKYIKNEALTYDGSQLHSLYALKEHGIQGDSAVAFLGPCDVAVERMVDVVDVLHNDKIFSHNMLHFIVEMFGVDLRTMVYVQRLLVCILYEVLLPCPGIRRDGDDLYIKDQKLTVSIATASPVSSLVHLGVNVRSDGTPVKTIGLADLGRIPYSVGGRVLRNLVQEIQEIELACCKVEGVK